MTSEWKTSKGATSRVTTFLEQAGIPLELQVAAVCKDFCASHATPKKIHVNSEAIIYSPSGPADDYREVDRNVSIYEEFEVGKLTGIQLVVNMPIECKHRRDIECFAFPIGEKTLHYGFPILSDLAGSELGRSLAASYTPLKHINVARIVLIEIKDGKTPHNIHKEQLIYNAAGSLYDFVMFDLESWIDVDEKKAGRGGIEQKLFHEFKRYLEETHYGWWTVLREWTCDIRAEECDLFNRKYFGDHRSYHAIVAHLPIVCINGPIYHVSWKVRSKVQSFDEIPYCLACIRKRGWPGKTRFKLAARGREAPVIVTNRAGLYRVLEIGFRWYEKIRHILANTSRQAERRWPLESAFFDQVVRFYTKQEGAAPYRSDVDTEKWL